MGERPVRSQHRGSEVRTVRFPILGNDTAALYLAATQFAGPRHAEERSQPGLQETTHRPQGRTGGRRALAASGGREVEDVRVVRVEGRERGAAAGRNRTRRVV